MRTDTGAKISYRQLDSNGEPMWGQGNTEFLADVDAVAQAIMTRLLLFEGEWWANRLEGLPLWQRMLGVAGTGSNESQISLLIQRRIQGTPFVRNITNVQTSYDHNTRKYTFYCVAQTEFGAIVVTNTPVVPSQGLPQ